MNLHLNKALYKDAISITAQRMKIQPEFIEKDYWVTFALYTIFNDAIGKDTVFKGGTALSKCYGIIERFSEDIDLVVLRREGESNNKLTTKIKTIGEVVSNVLPEVTIEGLTHKMGMNRKTAHSYTKVFEGNYGQVRDAIVVEATWLGYYEPYTSKNITSFVGEMMFNNGQESIAKDHGLLPFEVLVLEPTRTICEKIMSLVRFSYDDDAINVLKKKIRHVYDLHQLLQQKTFADFFVSTDFEAMLLKVASDDVASYKNDNKWLANHPNNAIVFKDLENVWSQLQATYNGDFKSLVYGKLTDEKEIATTLKTIKDRLEKVTWKVELNPGN